MTGPMAADTPGCGRECAPVRSEYIFGASHTITKTTGDFVQPTAEIQLVPRTDRQRLAVCHCPLAPAAAPFQADLWPKTFSRI